MKKLLTLLMLLCMVCAGAWADGVMPENIRLSTDANKVYYTIKGKNNDYAYYSSTSGNKVHRQARINLTSLFYFTASDVTPTKDGFRAVKIHNFSAGNACMENWTTWSETGNTYYLHAAFGTGAPAGSVNICTFEIEASTTNTNACWNHQGGGVLGWTARSNMGRDASADTGSCWVIEEYDGPVPGNVYTIENAQQGSHFYPLYVTNSTLTKGTQDKPIADFSVNAQWLAESNAVGKMSFKNVATGEYLIWRGNTSGGYNSNKGTNPSYVASYCDWDMYKGTGDYSEYYRICSKRNDNSDGSLTIHKGNFDGYGNSDYWSSEGTNVMRFTKVENPHNPEMPVAGKVYTVFNDHVGVPYFVSKNRTVNANAQDITATRTTDGSQEWIFWGDATNNYKFYNLSDNSIALKSYDGQETHKVINERSKNGYTVVQPTNGSKRIGGDTHNPSLNGGIFSSGTYNEYDNGDLHWSTDFVFVPTGENAYKVVIVNGASNTSVTYNGQTVSNNGFLIVDDNVIADAICAGLTKNNEPTGFSASVAADGNVITVEYKPVGDETIIYNPNKNKYVNAGLTLAEGVENAATFIKVSCGENATYPTTNGQEYPKFKLFVSGKGWVSKATDDTDMTTKGGSKFGFSTDGTKALEFIYVGNDIIPVVCFGYTDGEHGQLSWNWYANTGVLGLYGVDDNGCNWTFNTQYTINSTGLQNSEVGGVCYNRVNYAGATAMLPAELDSDALIAMHVSGYNGTISSVEGSVITVTYSTEAETTSTLWHGNLATDSNKIVPASRIPAIITTNSGEILAFSDWRYNFNDIGRGDMGGHIDIEMRRSTDGGQTWEPAIIAARGTGSGATAGYGDAAVVADRTTSESQQVLLLAAAGNVTYTANNRANSIRMAKFTSSNNGATWSEATDITSDIFAILPETVKAFFATSGKITQASFKAEGATHNRIYCVLCTTTDGGSTNTNYVIYSDNFGQNWAVLGGTETPAMAGGNEAHVVELPNGDLLLDSRAGGRLVNLFTYSDKNTGAGTWGASGQKSINVGTACNGDIDLVDCYKRGSSDPVKVLIQSAPRASSRSNIRYYYKELPAQTDGHYTLSDFVGGWTEGYQVCAGSSAYSSITSAGTGVEYMLYEKNTNGNTFNYDIEFEKHDISLITNNAYFSDDPTVEQTIEAILSDGNGNTFRHQYQGAIGTLPTVPSYCTVATNGTWAKVDDHYTYTADITMPFVVSNAENQKYYNMYFPIGDAVDGIKSPTYLYYNSSNASKLANEHSKVANINHIEEAQVWSASKDDSYKYSWAIYGDPFTGFTFKNRQSGTFISIEGVSASGTQNANLAAEGSVFTLDYATSGTYNGRWTMQSGTGYIVIWSCNNDVATYNTNVNHAGGHFHLVEAPDFEALTNTLAEKCDGLGTTLGTYAYTGTVEDLFIAQSIAAGQLTPANAKQLKTYIDAMTNGRGGLNMPKPGMFLRLKSHKFGTYLNSATVAWNGNSNLLTLVNGKTGNNEKTTIMYLTEDRRLVTYATGMGLCNSIQIKTANSDPYEGNTVLTFSEDSKNNAGCYNIKGTYGSTNNYLYGYSDKLARNGSVTDECVWELEEVQTLPLTVGETKFATFYTPVELQVPEGVTAYVCNLDGENLAMYTCKQTDGEHTLIPAGTAVMLNAPEQAEATAYNFTIPATAQAEEYTNNSFFGSVATKAFADDYTYYSLQRDNQNAGQVGFFIKPSGNFKGFQAFLKTEASQQVQRFNVTFDEDAVITGFANVLGNVNITIPAFDLSGRKVDANSHRGIYIMNGKKVIR